MLSPAGVCCNINPSLCEWVIETSASPPIKMSAPSDNIKISSPTPKSAATPIPPATVNAPSVEPVEAVVAVMDTTPPEEIPIAFVSLAEPIVPASGMTMFPPVVISPAPV